MNPLVKWFLENISYNFVKGVRVNVLSMSNVHVYSNSSRIMCNSKFYITLNSLQSCTTLSLSDDMILAKKDEDRVKIF